jgi:hypothetical protein
MPSLVPYLDRAWAAANLNRASIYIVFNYLYAGSGPSFEEFDQRRPVERGTIWKMDNNSSLAIYRLAPSAWQEAKFSGGLPERFPHGMVKLANTPETGAWRDFGDRNICLKD